MFVFKCLWKFLFLFYTSEIKHNSLTIYFVPSAVETALWAIISNSLASDLLDSLSE